MNDITCSFRYIKVCISLLILMTQCQRISSKDSVQNIPNTPILEILTTDSIFIRWDKPANLSQLISKYELLYRVHGNNTWTPLNYDISVSDSPWVTVYRDDLSNKDSLFDFAVRIYFNSGDTSEPHISIDTTSTPKGGWFVKW